MDEIKQTVVRLVLTLGFLFGIVWFLKHGTKVSIAADNKGMNEASFPEGRYGVKTSIFKIADLKTGDAVAYRLTGDSINKHIGRVVAVEGQRVAFTLTGVTVDGAALPFKPQLDKILQPEFKVPRGCVYVLADNPTLASDSFRNGPIPFINILGTVQPLNKS